jgi:hypothetical protein
VCVAGAFQARELLLPAWVDSVHHVLVVRLIEQNGGIPTSFAPYFDVAFTYHYGFHLLAAIFSTLTLAPAEQGVLWFGQLINALVALSVYRLGRAAWHDRRAALLAAVLVGFVFQMPAYYLLGDAIRDTGLLCCRPLWRCPGRPTNRGARNWFAPWSFTPRVAFVHYTACSCS